MPDRICFPEPTFTIFKTAAVSLNEPENIVFAFADPVVKVNVPAYELCGHVVWGATAMMLSEIKNLLGQLT